MRGSSALPVEKRVTCKRCGDAYCAWLQTKAGRWYLADVWSATGVIGWATHRAAVHRCGHPKHGWEGGIGPVPGK